MPAAALPNPPWATGSWSATAWEEDTWGPAAVVVPVITPSVPRHGLSGRETGHLTDFLRRQDHWVDLLPSGPLVQTPARLGNRFRVYLTVNTVIEPPHTPHNGQAILWRIEQDNTGGRTVAFNTGGFSTVGSLPVPVNQTANAVSFVEAIYDEVAGGWEMMGVTDLSSLYDAAGSAAAVAADLATHEADTANPHSTEVIDDTTPQLGGDLDANGKKIMAGAAADLILKMADAAGALAVSFTDSGDTEVASIHSTGILSITSFSTVGGTAITQTYSTTATTHAAMTYTAPTDSTTGTAGSSVDDVSVSFNQGLLNDNFATILAELDALADDLVNLKGIVNTVIDNSQAGHQTK